MHVKVIQEWFTAAVFSGLAYRCQSSGQWASCVPAASVRLEQGRQVQTERAANPRTGFPGIPYAARMRRPDLRRAWYGCLSGKVNLFHGVNGLEAPSAVHVYAHLRPYVGFIIRWTAAVPNHGERSWHNESSHSHGSESVLPTSRRWSWRLLRRSSCEVHEGDPAFQPCLLETLV